MSKNEKAINPSLYDVIVKPVITEKSQNMSVQGKYMFVVTSCADKEKVSEAITKVFDVKVDKVNIINRKGKNKHFRGKLGRTKDTKRAIVTLADGQSLDVAAFVG